MAFSDDFSVDSIAQYTIEEIGATVSISGGEMNFTGPPGGAAFASVSGFTGGYAQVKFTGVDASAIAAVQLTFADDTSAFVAAYTGYAYAAAGAGSDMVEFTFPATIWLRVTLDSGNAILAIYDMDPSSGSPTPIFERTYAVDTSPEYTARLLGSSGTAADDFVVTGAGGGGGGGAPSEPGTVVVIGGRGGARVKRRHIAGG